MSGDDGDRAGHRNRDDVARVRKRHIHLIRLFRCHNRGYGAGA